MVSAAGQELARGTVAHLQPACTVVSTQFDNIVAEGVRLRESHLADCVFHGAVMIGVDLTGAVLERVRFVDCHLAGAIFEQTQLDDVVFTNCNLSGSRFSHTCMDTVELDHVDRQGWRCDERLWQRFPGYELEKLLGGGDDARTYRAKRRGRVRPVALKVFQSTAGDFDTLGERLREHEGPLGKKVRSKHVAKVVGFGVVTRTGEPFVATEHLVGETLAEALESEAWAATDEDVRVRLFCEMASGLAAIHQEAGGVWQRPGGPQVQHGDIRPSNIFLARDRKRRIAKLIDFGTVRHGRAYPANITRTTAARVAYDPPEAILGGTIGGAAADIYALGLTMFQALHGTHPYLSRVRAMCEEQRHGALTRAELVKLINQLVSQLPLDDVRPTRLRPILRRCMQVVPKLRYRDGTELYQALGTL